MEELAQIFGRSKATIHECIKDTEKAWWEFRKLVDHETEIDDIARRELIEERKEALRKEEEFKRESETKNSNK